MVAANCHAERSGVGIEGVDFHGGVADTRADVAAGGERGRLSRGSRWSCNFAFGTGSTLGIGWACDEQSRGPEQGSEKFDHASLLSVPPLRGLCWAVRFPTRGLP